MQHTKAYLLAAVAALQLSVLPSCSKDENAQPSMLQEQAESKVQSAPFFELAKGDTIAKGIYREKPEFYDDSVTVLFSSEDYEKRNPRLKAIGTSEGTSGYFIDDIKGHVGGNAPDTRDGYTKIPVDLNEGAGGQYIYLYYRKNNIGRFTSLNAFTSWRPELPFASSSKRALGVNFDNSLWTDLNRGAGGPFIYIEGSYASGPTDSPLRVSDILVISSTSKVTAYGDWHVIPQDLNEGAGGKWIYLCYKQR